MKTHPIIFSGPMIQRLLDGSKTQTRRIVKPQPTKEAFGMQWLPKRSKGLYCTQAVNCELDIAFHCPYGKSGDLLWVREAFSAYGDFAKYGMGRVSYRANCERQPQGLPWKPSIHMPRWASRLTLEITDVRVERVQDISEGDARAEGIEVDECGHAIRPNDDIAWGSARGAFAELWESIHGDGAWTVNSWVWVLAFRIHHCNVDKFIKQKTA